MTDQPDQINEEPEEIHPPEPNGKGGKKHKKSRSADKPPALDLFDLPHHVLPQVVSEKNVPSNPESDLDMARLSRILGDRARQMAKPLYEDENGEADLTIVNLNIAGERYAFSVSAVRDIQPVPQITPIPCTPLFVAGIVNLRGRIISILDIRRFLGLEHTPQPNYQMLVVVDGGGLHVGLLVDEVSGVEAIRSKELRPPTGNLIGLRAEYIQGLLPDMRALLDLDALLSNPEIIIAEEV